MRLATLCLLLLAACAQPKPLARTSTPADWADLADALSSEEYAETFIEELEDRLDAADADLTREQQEALYTVLYDGAERHRAIVARFRESGPAQRAEAEAAFKASDCGDDRGGRGHPSPGADPHLPRRSRPKSRSSSSNR